MNNAPHIAVYRTSLGRCFFVVYSGATSASVTSVLFTSIEAMQTVIDDIKCHMAEESRYVQLRTRTGAHCFAFRSSGGHPLGISTQVASPEEAQAAQREFIRRTRGGVQISWN